MKKSGIIKLIVAVAVIFLLVRFCSTNLGSIIQLPGSTTSGGSTEETGGWLNPKKSSNDGTVSKDIAEDIKELERELGIGSNKGKTTTTTTTPSTTTNTTTTYSSSTPLSFKGVPITGSLSSFGNELVKAGFRSAGNGTYTGDFAGYSGCKVTPSGSNPVREVRVDFPVISDWDALEKAYDSLQASLTQKYGMEPKTTTNSNLAVYDLPNGTISLDADVKDRSTWHVILTYANASTLTTNPSTGRNPIDDL
jgi:hypothetical protein